MTLDMSGGGTLSIREDGLRVYLEARREADGLGLYKVWLTGRGSGRFLLGTLAPAGAGLRLRRNLSRTQLEMADCWPVAGAESRLAFSFARNGGWYCQTRPGEMLSDPVLKEQVPGAMLCRRGNDGFQLAAPMRPECPMPLAGAACLARVEQVQGRPHFVWDFAWSGTLKIPARREQPGGGRQKEITQVNPRTEENSFFKK